MRYIIKIRLYGAIKPCCAPPRMRTRVYGRIVVMYRAKKETISLSKLMLLAIYKTHLSGVQKGPETIQRFFTLLKGVRGPSQHDPYYTCIIRFRMHAIHHQNLFVPHDKTLLSATPHVNAYKCKNCSGAPCRKRRQSRVRYTCPLQKAKQFPKKAELDCTSYRRHATNDRTGSLQKAKRFRFFLK